MWRRVEGVKAWRRKKWPLVDPSLPLRRSVWSLPTGWRGIGFYNDTAIWGNNWKVASLVLYNSATIQRAAFRRVGSSVSGMLGLSRLSLASERIPACLLPLPLPPSHSCHWNTEHALTFVSTFWQEDDLGDDLKHGEVGVNEGQVKYGLSLLVLFKGGQGKFWWSLISDDNGWFSMMTRMAIGDGLPNMCKGAQGGFGRRSEDKEENVPSCRV